MASTLLHAGVLLLTLVSFTGAKPFEPMPESLPVDVISASDFTKLTKGSKTAQKADKPRQVAEKVDTPTPVEDPKLKVSPQPPVEATAPPPPPPPPPPKVDQQQPAPPKAEQAPPKEQADVALKTEPKKQEPPKEEPKAEAAAAPLPPRKPAPPREQPKPIEANAPSREFNTDQIKDLIDKRTPTRQVASADAVSTTASLGAPSGQAASLSISEIDAFKSRMRQCWNTAGLPPDQRIYVLLKVDFRADGTLVAEPVVMEGSGPPYGPALFRSAVSALTRCQPYTMFRKETYNTWKSMELKFDPTMFDR